MLLRNFLVHFLIIPSAPTITRIVVVLRFYIFVTFHLQLFLFTELPESPKEIPWSYGTLMSISWQNLFRWCLIIISSVFSLIESGSGDTSSHCNCCHLVKTMHQWLDCRPTGFKPPPLKPGCQNPNKYGKVSHFWLPYAFCKIWWPIWFEHRL